ncbi:MAG: hypothetical protein JKY00_03905 [Roseicyclus sp.]|nr:hypothetical protein [Roseicyclus sp.]
MTFLRPLILASIVAVVAAPATAQVEALTLSNITVTRYESLPNIDPKMAMPCCARHTYESGGDYDFIYIDADFAVAWSDDLDRIQIRSSHIGLQLPGETDTRQAWGRINYFPEIERGGSSISARRPRDFPAETAGAFLNQVFAVPAGATEATLVIGEGADAMQIPVDLAVPITEMPAAASFYDIKINGISTTSELTTEERISREEIEGRVVATIGTIVRMEVEINPSISTDTDAEPGENQTLFRNTAFGLVGPEGLPLVPIGRTVGESIRNDYSHSASWDGDEAGPTINLTLFFLGSGAAGDYQLYFYDQQVGGIAIE